MNRIEYHYAASGQFELVLVHAQGHTAYPWHMHTRHYTAGLLRHGSVLLAEVANTRQLCAGQHFFIRPCEPHSLNLAPESSLLVLCFTANANLVMHGAAALQNIALIQDREQVWLDEVARQCKEHILSSSTSFAAAKTRTLEPFGADGRTNQASPLDESATRRQAADEPLLLRSILEIAQWSMENPAEVLPLEQMASLSGYSQWHFLRAFRKITKITPHAFQLFCRLHLLRSMLRADTASATAAVSAGFADQSHMHKFFKRHHGMTPGEFKKASFKLEL